MSSRFIRSADQRNEALGRSRGGLGTKVVGVCDAARRLVDFVLAPGQAQELALLRHLPEAPDWALAGMARDALAFREAASAMGAIPVVPSCKGTKQLQPHPAYIYRHSQPDRALLGTLSRSDALSPPDTTRPHSATAIAIAASLDWIKALI